MKTILITCLLLAAGAFGAEPAQPATPSSTPLTDAFKARDKGLMRKIHWKDSFRNRNLPGHPLLMAAYAGREDMVRQLIAEGADVNEASADGVTALHLAAERKSVAMVRMLVEAGANVNAESQDSCGRYPLSCALRDMTYSGRLKPELIECLLQAGADIHCRAGYNGESPLSLACNYSSPEIVQLFLKAGADVHEQDENGLDALSCFSAEEFYYSKTAEILPILLAAGADVNRVTDSHGRTPLILSMESRLNGEKMLGLLHAGADVNAKDAEGRTALFHAMDKFGTDKIQLLLAYGADVNARDNYGNTPLHLAAMYGDVARLDLLVRAGADVTATNAKGRTPLMLAAMYGFWHSMVYLADRGTDINAKDSQGRTALMLAVLHGSADTVSALLHAGADPSATDNNGDTALDLARANEKDKAAKLLQAKGK